VLNDNPALRGKVKSSGGATPNKRHEKRKIYNEDEPLKQMEEPNQKAEPKQKTKRKYKLHLRVPVEIEEGEIIKQQAENCGISISEYLRRLGLGYQPTSIVDNQKVNELAKINGDLGRLGGLLKLWLSDDKRVAHFDKNTIVKLLKEIEGTRIQMTDVMMKVIKSKN